MLDSLSRNRLAGSSDSTAAKSGWSSVDLRADQCDPNAIREGKVKNTGSFSSLLSQPSACLCLSAPGMLRVGPEGL